MTMFGKDARMASVESRLSKLKGGSAPRMPKAKGGKVSVVDTGTPQEAKKFLRAEGDMPKARADKPSRKAYASGGRAKSPTTVNVVVAPRGGDKDIVPVPVGGMPGAPAGGPPMPPPAPPPAMGGPAPSTTLALKTGGRVARKAGGRVCKADGGEVPARGKGMASAIDADDRGTARLGKRMPKAAGGEAEQVPMTPKGENALKRLSDYPMSGKRNGGRVTKAGAGSGEGRLEKY